MLNRSNATTRDKRFIIDSILSGAKKGRTVLDGYFPASMKNIRSEIHSILHSNRTLGGDRASALIYKRAGKRVGVAILSSGRDGDTGPALYAMAVAPGNRGKGYGRLIVDGIDRRYPADHYHGRRTRNTVALRKLFARPKRDRHPVVPDAEASAEGYQEAA